MEMMDHLMAEKLSKTMDSQMGQVAPKKIFKKNTHKIIIVKVIHMELLKTSFLSTDMIKFEKVTD